MNYTTWQVERAAVLAAQRSLLLHTDFIDAAPSIDRGIDLLAFRPDPFTAIPIQVKGTQTGLKVYYKHTSTELLMAYVLDPLDTDPMVCLLTGTEAWNLIEEYKKQGGKAKLDDDHASYRWSNMTKLLTEMLRQHEATQDRWEQYLTAATNQSSAGF